MLDKLATNSFAFYLDEVRESIATSLASSPGQIFRLR